MSISDFFKEFLANLAVPNDRATTISNRYGEITSSLNLCFRETDSKTLYTLQVGSYGRWTAIKGISDLDMIYIIPQSKWDIYKDKQSKLLSDLKEAIIKRYPRTEVYVDRLVVRVLYQDFHIEIQPAFEQDDGSFKYPDTYNGGAWKITKPRQEIEAMKEQNNKKNKNLRRLCKMVRAWKNKHGIEMGGLLIDTLAYNFMNSTAEYDETSYSCYHYMIRDFFKYLSEESDKDYYLALGSLQRVRVKKKFQEKSKKAYELCLEAIEAKDQKNENLKWKKIFGREFPTEKGSGFAEDSKILSYNNTEEFIEDKFQVDIRYSISIDCIVSQNGFRDHFLRNLLKMRALLKPDKRLQFHVVETNVPCPYDLYWKILNRGDEAKKRNQIRGDIIKDKGNKERIEDTRFRGDHIVECYAVKDNIVVAKDRIHVPIDSNAEDAYVR